jgi:negative regulator of flagellin synthesis FlgM
MKIDLNVPAVPLTSVTRPVSSPAANGDSAVQGASEDRVTLGSSTASVQSLTAKAMSTPAIRQDKVEALQSAIQSGSYKVDPEEIASAMAADHGSKD